MRCLQVNAGDDFIVTENGDKYLIVPFRTGQFYPAYDIHSSKYPEEKIGYKLEKLSGKARFDFDVMYGDGSDNTKANWCCNHFPVVKNDQGELIWDY